MQKFSSVKTVLFCLTLVKVMLTTVDTPLTLEAANSHCSSMMVLLVYWLFSTQWFRTSVSCNLESLPYYTYDSQISVGGFSIPACWKGERGWKTMFGESDGPRLEEVLHYFLTPFPWFELRRRTNKTAGKGNFSVCSGMWGDGLPCNSYLFIFIELPLWFR